MDSGDSRAVVIGAGIGGLLAARALRDSFTEVTVFDRDVLPSDASPRKCVPQARHVHALLASGQTAIEALLPGFARELVELGAISGDALADVRWVVDGHRMARGRSGVSGVLASRCLIEWQVRQRIQQIGNIEIVDRCEVTGLTGDSKRVTGVEIRRRGSPSSAETVPAELVVDSSGRSARSGAWLESLGIPRPAEEKMAVDVTYATRHFRLDRSELCGDAGIGVAPGPANPRSGLMAIQEDGNWVVTLAGYGKDWPPLDLAGFLEFARSFPQPDMYDALRKAEPVDDGLRYRIPTTVRRRFDAAQLPSQYLPFADAICCFNPIYGQGMSVAAIEAILLRDCLRASPHEVTRRFLRLASTPVANAWDLTVYNDLRIPGVPGTRTARIRLTNAYLSRLYRASAVDPAVGAAFFRVTHLLDRPTALLKPSTALRVLRANLRLGCGDRKLVLP